ncbi:MAG: histidinol-phosphate/aromatic aminotransferase and cobyric acid decarboxylase [Pseudonocardiales bacterium]|nr:MAG: histidinol-phosphate/aromatic aminotransferase and cobyric acid decarboxylase [Pseudonocardiales bacterium]
MGSGQSKSHESFAVTPTQLPYATGIAFAAALTAKIKAAAAAGAGDVNALRRQFAYDRLLSRLFTTPDPVTAAGEGDGGCWVLKGGTALLTRVRGARHTLDIDLLHQSTHDVEAAVSALRAAAQSELGDHFSFTLGPAAPIATATHATVEGRQVPVTARCGTTVFAQFKIDLVVTDHMSSAPEPMTPQPIVDIPGLAQPSYQLYPLADHVADKLTATRLTYGTDHLPSSRVRDLVDLALIARTQHLDAAALSTAITAKRLLHELPATDTFTTPASWPAIFGKAAAGTELGDHATYPQALALAKQLLDPLLAGTRQHGTWNPESLSWVD